MAEWWIVLIVTAVIVAVTVHVLGWALRPLIRNIIGGGILYWLIDAGGIVPLPWGLMDTLIVAFFGIPGTIGIAVWRAWWG